MHKPWRKEGTKKNMENLEQVFVAIKFVGKLRLHSAQQNNVTEWRPSLHHPRILDFAKRFAYFEFIIFWVGKGRVHAIMFIAEFLRIRTIEIYRFFIPCIFARPFLRSL